MAYQGHIVIPTSHERAESIIEDIEAKLTVKYGGYSRYEGVGGWDGENQVMTEDHVRLVVDTDEEDRETFRGSLRIEACYVKAALEEEAVLIEIHQMEMELV